MVVRAEGLGEVRELVRKVHDHLGVRASAAIRRSRAARRKRAWSDDSRASSGAARVAATVL